MAATAAPSRLETRQREDEARRSALDKISAAAKQYHFRRKTSHDSLTAMKGPPMAPHEFSQRLRNAFAISVTKTEVQVLVDLFDNDGDGKIDTAEFVFPLSSVGGPTPVRRDTTVV